MMVVIVTQFLSVVASHQHHHDESSHGGGFVHGTSCGHAHYSEHFPEPVIQKQNYAGQTPHEDVERRRRLGVPTQTAGERYAGQNSTDTSTFLPLEGANSATSQGLLRGIRVKLNFEMINDGIVKDKRACYAGDSNGDGGKGKIVVSDKKDPVASHDTYDTFTYRCTVDDEISDIKRELVKKRIRWLGSFVTSMLSIKPMTDKLVVVPAALQDDMGSPSNPNDLYDWTNSNLGSGDYQTVAGPITELNYADYDLIVYVQMRPDPTGSTAGYAGCRQQDQWGRCTVGNFNWNPAVIEVGEMQSTADVSDDSKEDPMQQAQERHTALHELIHVLGGIKSDSQIDANGNAKAFSDVFVIDDDVVDLGDGNSVNRQSKKLKTPKVLEIAREQFGCDTMKGVPLEDQKLGRNAHWEARLMGPEVMSYGSYTGESYLSDLTIAMLQDTGHYVGNFSVAGRLVPAAPYAPKTSTVGNLFSTGAQSGQSNDVTPVYLSRGYLRWGRKQGCAFVEGHPQDWSERYACNTDGPDGYGCTPDNRMSARCVMGVWGKDAISQATALRASKSFTDPLSSITPPVCGSGNTDPVCSITLKPQQSATGGNGKSLPPLYQYPKLVGDSAKTYLAGWSDAMDFVPVRVGSYSCLDNKAIYLSGSTTKATGGNQLSMSMDNVYGDITSYGGQYRSSKSRCFPSSLQSAKTFNPAFSRLGLCYASNCYQKDYLQVGVKTKVGGIVWYGCPRGGGKVLISGFLGSIQCPDATEFCIQEDITGFLYAEALGWWVEYVFWGVVFVVFVCVPFCCCCWCTLCGRVRRFFSRILKKLCGIYMAHGELGQSKAFKIAKARRNEKYKRSIASHCLRCFNCCCSCVGLLVLVFGSIGVVMRWFAVKPLYGALPYQANYIAICGFCLWVYSIFGIMTAHQDSISIKLVFYIYITIAVICGSAFLVASCFFLRKSLEAWVERNWELEKEKFPDSWQNLTHSEAMTKMDSTITDNIIILCVAIVAIAATFLGAVLCAIRMLTCRVLLRNMLVVVNLFFACHGVAIMVLTIVMFYVLDAGPLMLAIVPVIVLLVQGTCGIITSQTGWPICTFGYIFVAAFSSVIMLADGVTMLAWGSGQVWTKVASLPDGDGYTDAPGFKDRVARLPLADDSMPIQDMATYAESLYKLAAFSALIAGVVLAIMAIVSIPVCCEERKLHKQEVEYKKREKLRKEMGLPTMMLDLPGFAEEYGSKGNEHVHEKEIELEDMRKKHVSVNPHLRRRRHDWDDLLANNSMMI
jgi:hypothetical protein